jgi:uncharacterized oxidoreductase
MKQSNQKVLITGGGSGIGLALARKFLDKKNTVIIIGRNLSKLEKVKTELPDIHIYQSDVTQEKEVKALEATIQRDFGGIDVLINNAGVMHLLDSGDEGNDLQKQVDEIAINYQAPVRMLHHFLSQLKRSENAVLVNVSSGLAYVPYAQSPVYSGTKAAVHFWTKSIRPQLKPHHIKVIELLPPVVDTKLAKDADLKDDNLKPMSPERMTHIFWKDYKKGKEEITPGISTALKIMSRIAPEFIFKQLNKQPIPKK